MKNITLHGLQMRVLQTTDSRRVSAVAPAVKMLDDGSWVDADIAFTRVIYPKYTPSGFTPCLCQTLDGWVLTDFSNITVVKLRNGHTQQEQHTYTFLKGPMSFKEAVREFYNAMAIRRLEGIDTST